MAHCTTGVSPVAAFQMSAVAALALAAFLRSFRDAVWQLLPVRVALDCVIFLLKSLLLWPIVEYREAVSVQAWEGGGQ